MYPSLIGSCVSSRHFCVTVLLLAAHILNSKNPFAYVVSSTLIKISERQKFQIAYSIHSYSIPLKSMSDRYRPTGILSGR